MMFFVSKINSYSCVNNKGREVQKWLESFAHHLIPNELSKDAWIEDLRLKLQDFDEQFPRSTPLFLDKTSIHIPHYFSTKIRNSACRFKYYSYICSAQHLKQAEIFANYAVGIFYAHGITYSSDPRVVCLMATQPVSGVEQRESGTFFFLSSLKFLGESPLSRTLLTYCLTSF